MAQAVAVAVRVGVAALQPVGLYTTAEPAGGAEPQVDAVKCVPSNSIPVAGLPTVELVAP